MTSSPSSAGSRGSLANAVDIVIAPNAAFDRINTVPRWFWPFVVAAVFSIAGSLLILPAIQHSMDTTMPQQLMANPAFAKLPPDKQSAQIAKSVAIAKTITSFTWILVPIVLLIVGLLQGLVLTLFNAIGKGQGTFAKFFALSITVSVIGSGIYYLVVAAIVLLRGPASFDTQLSITGSIPNLALLAPGAHGFLLGFLTGLNVFFLWCGALLAFGAMRIGKIAPAPAWTAAAIIVVCTAAFVGFGSMNS
ncbi:MAG TPA: hypothetical protein VGN14_11705 [Candidatus Elarobacter sp.]